MQLPKDISDYLRARASELAERILHMYPPLHGVDQPASPLTGQLLRKPFPAQTLAMMDVVKRWNEARGAAVVAECGTGKTLISLGAVHVHSDRMPFTALAMVPPQLVENWAREAFLTLPRVRVFFMERTEAIGNRSVGLPAKYVLHMLREIVVGNLHATRSTLIVGQGALTGAGPYQNTIDAIRRSGACSCPRQTSQERVCLALEFSYGKKLQRSKYRRISA